MPGSESDGKDSGLQTQAKEPLVAGGHRKQGKGENDLLIAGGRRRQSKQD